jgi:ferrous iron transport protein B
MDRKEIALIGNPNSGKTTIFNILTGSNAKVGNWPGVTVEKKEGALIGHSDFQIVDLPGIYSLSAYSDDEKVAKNSLLKKPAIVVDILDSSNLKRNLYLTIQLLEMNQNVILGLNVMDVALKKYKEIKLDVLSELLDVPVVPLVGQKGEGIEDLINTIVEYKEHETVEFRLPYGGELEEHIKNLEELFAEKKVLISGYTHRMLAIQSLEGDEIVRSLLKPYGFDDYLQKEIDHLNSIFKDDLEMVFIEKRYGFIEGLLKKMLVRKKTIENSIGTSDQVDKVVLNPVIGILIFFGVMFTLFQITFFFGDYIKSFLELLLSGISTFITSNVNNDILSSFLNDGVLSGVGTIITFLPNLILMFLLLTFLEDIGYMARAAYLMDRFMRYFGLQGKAFIPLITGFGCTVPAVMSTRTLESKSDRFTTILITPLISCSARLPVYVLFISAFFPDNRGSILFFVYIMGIVLAVLMAKLFRIFFFKDGAAPFVLELPPYRIPTAKATFIHTWERVKEFLTRASTLILAMVIIVWALSILPLGVDYGSSDSIIGIIGSFIAPILTPVGFGTYEAATALISGIVAKEVVVSTLGTIYGADGGGLVNVLANEWTRLQGFSFMLMSAIYIPCLATLATIKQETNSWKWMFFVIAYTSVLGYIVSLIVFQVGTMLGF